MSTAILYLMEVSAMVTVTEVMVTAINMDTLMIMAIAMDSLMVRSIAMVSTYCHRASLDSILTLLIFLNRREVADCLFL